MSSTQAAEAATKREPITRVFKHDGRTFEYNYSILSLIQVQRAETVFRYREEQESNPPLTLELLQSSSGGEYLVEAFRHLLVEIDADGKYRKYDKDSAGRGTRDWLEEIPATYWSELRECRLDFFHWAQLQDIESIKRFIRGNKLQLDALELQAKAGAVATDIAKLQKELVGSTIEANLITDTENSEKTELLGS